MKISDDAFEFLFLGRQLIQWDQLDKGASEEADRIRDEMDIYWQNMHSDERYDILRQLNRELDVSRGDIPT